MADCDTEFDRLATPYVDLVDFEYPSGTAARLQQLGKRSTEIVERLSQEPARTLSG